MAIALQDGVLVWQKVAKALANANPASQKAFYDLKTYLTTQGQNPQLQFVPFTAAQITTAGGYSPDVDACTIYGVYGKARRTTGTTASFIQLFNQADNTASTTLITFVNRVNAVGQQFAAIFPTGYPHTTELTIAADTTVAGDTESSSADAVDGFVIVGA
jgi:hypothetical protein